MGAKGLRLILLRRLFRGKGEVGGGGGGAVLLGVSVSGSGGCAAEGGEKISSSLTNG